MADINFLPRELRGKEEEIRKKTDRKSGGFNVELTTAFKEKREKEESKGKDRFSFSKLYKSVFKPKSGEKKKFDIKMPRPAFEPKKPLDQGENEPLAVRKPFVSKVYQIDKAQTKNFGQGENFEIKNQGQKAVQKTGFWQKIFKTKANKPVLMSPETTGVLVEKAAKAQDQDREEDRKEEKSKKSMPKAREQYFVRGGDVNLVPAGISLAVKSREKRNILLFTALGLFLIIGGLYFVLLFFLTQPEAATEVGQLDAKIAEADQQIIKFARSKKEAEKFNSIINEAKGLLNEHIYWTNFFNLLEKYTLPQVAYLSFGGEAGGKISLGAMALDYDILARQIAIFGKAKGFIKSLEVGGVSRENQELPFINFTLTLDVEPAVFKK